MTLVAERAREPLERYRIKGPGMFVIGPKELSLFEANEWLLAKRPLYPNLELNLQVEAAPGEWLTFDDGHV